MQRKDCGVHRAAGPAGRLGGGGLVLALLCAPAAAQTVQLWSASTVSRPRILVGDVARLQGFADGEQERLGQVLVAEAAPPGGQREVTLDELRACLRAAEVNLATIWLKGASTCTVSSAAQLTPTADGDDPSAPTLAAQIRSRIVEALECDPGELELVFEPADRGLLELSSPGHEFVLSFPGRPALGTVDVQVEIRRGDEPVRPRRMRVAVSLRRQVVVATGPIERGRVIRSEDVTLVRRSFHSAEAVGLTRLEEVVGQESRRDVRSGEMLRHGDLRPLELVQRNDLVAVVSHRDGILIECSGRALQHGHLGEIIEVRNEASGQTFHARVQGLRRAEVLADPQALAAGPGSPLQMATVPGADP